MLLGRRKLPPTPIGRFPKTIQPCKIVNCSCLIDTKLYVKCSKSVTLMSNWLKFGEIVPFGGRRPLNLRPAQCRSALLKSELQTFASHIHIFLCLCLCPIYALLNSELQTFVSHIHDQVFTGWMIQSCFIL